MNRVLNELLLGAQTVLGNHFIGMYLHGSLALGDFDLETSDIDFVVVTDDAMPEHEFVPTLQALHARMALGHPRWAMMLEGSYIPKSEIRRYDSDRANHLHVYQGNVQIEYHDAHWVVERYVLREYETVLSGPAPRTLIDPVHSNDLRRAVVQLMRSWWLPMAADPLQLTDSKYQSYCVVTMCRVLYTLVHGTVVSKPAAVRWAQETQSARWRALIDGTGPENTTSTTVLNDTCDFIRYTMERCYTGPGMD